MISRLFVPIHHVLGYMYLFAFALVHVLEPILGIPHGAEAWFQAMAYVHLTT